MIQRIRYEAERYLTPPLDAFWGWADAGDLIVWNDGPAITFRRELATMLANLACDGLPPLGAVLLLISAMRETWPEVSDSFSSHVQRASSDTIGPEERQALRVLRAGLDRVYHCVRNMQLDLQARKRLVETVFEAAPRQTDPVVGDTVLELLESPIDSHFASFSLKSGLRSIPWILANLTPGLERLNEETVQLREQTGLEALPAAADLDLPPGVRARSLIQSLLDDPELGGAARLARSVMAAVSLPRSVSQLDELPLGGLSGISNRGPLDRLLLSEIAHDGLTLAVRVAMNEALYLRRESPPGQLPRQRAMLLETGIRSWGIPRVFSTAAALALVAKTDELQEIAVLRAEGADLQPVDLTTRDGLISHLGALSLDAHPGPALASFVERISVNPEPAEPLLVLPEEVLDDRQFQLAADSVPNLFPALVITVNRDGGLRLCRWTSQGRSVIKEARLDLQAIFSPHGATMMPLQNINHESQLPAAFRAPLFPLLLPHDVDKSCTWSVRNQGVLSITADGRVMHWFRRGWGARELSRTVPPGPLWWAGTEAKGGCARAIVGDAARKGVHLLEVDLYACRCHTVRLDAISEACDEITEHRDLIYARHGPMVKLLDPETGRCVMVWGQGNDVRHVHGRLYQTEKGLALLCHDGLSVQLQPLPNPISRADVLCVLQPDANESLVAVTRSGRLLYSDGQGEREPQELTGGPFRLLGISRDQARVILAPVAETTRRPLRIDLVTGETTDVYGDVTDALEPGIQQFLREGSVLYRYQMIGAGADGLLCLKTAHGAIFRFCYHRAAKKLILKHNSEQRLPVVDWRPFRDGPQPPGLRLKLSTAEWEDGRRAVLDSRGLLHLVPTKRSAAEVTIFLRYGRLAGWTSLGKVWGDKFFTGDAAHVTDGQAFEHIQAFCRN